MYQDLKGKIISDEDWYWSVRWGKAKAHRYSIGWSSDERRLSTGRVLKNDHSGKEKAEEIFHDMGIVNTFENEEKPFTLDDLRKSLTRLQIQLKHGCGNHNCCINTPKGQGTNAICKCYPEDIAKQLKRLSELVAEEGQDWIDTVDNLGTDRELFMMGCDVCPHKPNKPCIECENCAYR